MMDKPRSVSIASASRASLAENTRSAYRQGWRRFADWCALHGVDPDAAAPGDAAAFLVAMAGGDTGGKGAPAAGQPLAPATIQVIVAAVNRGYRDRKRPSPMEDPTVVAVLRGLNRLSRTRRRQVRALCADQVAAILERCDDLPRDDAPRVRAARDAAVIAVGFAAALRRSEISALGVRDVEFTGPAGGAVRRVRGFSDPPPRQAASRWSPVLAGGSLVDSSAGSLAQLENGERRLDVAAPAEVGMLLHIRRSKTDQRGRGQRVAVPEGEVIRPVSRLLAWLRLSGIRSGPLFRSLRRGGHVQDRALDPSDIARLIKRHVAAIGLDPAEYSGHSLRAGFVTSAAECGARLDKIMEVTRHRSAANVLRYVRQADAFRDHAGRGFL